MNFLTRIWNFFFGDNEVKDMAISTRNTVTSNIVPPAPVQDLKPSVVVESSVTLRFSNGYKFRVSVEDSKMVMKADLNGQEAFFLDEIPPEFIRSLKNMLTAVGE